MNEERKQKGVKEGPLMSCMTCKMKENLEERKQLNERTGGCESYMSRREELETSVVITKLPLRRFLQHSYIKKLIN